MDFSWTPEQTAFRSSVVEFARRELNEGMGERDRTGAFDRETWRRCAALGLQGLMIPTEYGGGGADTLTTAGALEALGYGCLDNGLMFSLNAHMWSCAQPIREFGNEEQRRRYLPGLCDGTLIGVQAMTEPGTGSDALSLTTSAVRDGEHYVLNGAKVFITNAPVADVLLVFARTDPSAGFLGLSAFLVDRDRPGLSFGPPLEKMGLRTSPMSEVRLDDCVVPAGRLLGAPGTGWAIFRSAMDWERGLILATAVGTMERHLEQALEYARTRKQFGSPIGSFQAVSHRIVEMRLRWETARLLLYHLAWLRDQGRSTAAAAALVKLHLSHCFVESGLDTMQIFGGLGYASELGVERDVRDALGSRVYSGTSDIQRNIIARELGL
ncbi:acyl-CoA dehydrogenase family protein [Streptomyces sp. NPDC057638]|uniref:acyl-CoA dehydrogenase family protein n=1 Tax=Streptomyces sp. NPDC057638 TaxID=3346190 RepID=UPI0036B5BDE9